jgi:hypothetical protein
MGHLPETEPTESKIPIEGATSTAIPATIPEACRELQALAHFSDSCYSSHKISLRRRACRGNGGHRFFLGRWLT